MKYARLFMTLSILLALLLLALWLLPGVPHQWRTWRAPSPQPPELQDALATLLAPNPAAGASYSEVVERPLFAANRRPSPADASAAAPPPTPIDQARLLGIVTGKGVNGVMIDYDGKSRFVHKGEDVGGWQLTDIHDRTATFAHEGQQRDLTLPLISPAGAAAAAPAPAPAGGASLANRLSGDGAAPAATPAPAPAAAPVPAATPAPAGRARPSIGGRGAARPRS
jgi:general secretion pathway protein N